RPLDLDVITTPVCFVGGQTSNYFAPGATHRADTQLAGVLAMSRRADNPGATFFDTYYEDLQLAPHPTSIEDINRRMEAMVHYFNAKLAYTAMLWVAQRNRWVVTLIKKLGRDFRVVGRNWEALG